MADDLQPPDIQLPQQQAPDLGQSPQQILSGLPKLAQQDDPISQALASEMQRYQAANLPPASGGMVKRLLTNFVGSMSHGMMPPHDCLDQRSGHGCIPSIGSRAAQSG